MRPSEQIDRLQAVEAQLRQLQKDVVQGVEETYDRGQLSDLLLAVEGILGSHDRHIGVPATAALRLALADEERRWSSGGSQEGPSSRATALHAFADNLSAATDELGRVQGRLRDAAEQLRSGRLTTRRSAPADVDDISWRALLLEGTDQDALADVVEDATPLLRRVGTTGVLLSRERPPADVMDPHGRALGVTAPLRTGRGPLASMVFSRPPTAKQVEGLMAVLRRVAEDRGVQLGSVVDFEPHDFPERWWPRSRRGAGRRLRVEGRALEGVDSAVCIAGGSADHVTALAAVGERGMMVDETGFEWDMDELDRQRMERRRWGVGAEPYTPNYNSDVQLTSAGPVVWWDNKDGPSPLWQDRMVDIVEEELHRHGLLPAVLIASPTEAGM